VSEEDDLDLDSALDAWADSFDASTSQVPPPFKPEKERKRQSNRPTSPPPMGVKDLASQFPIFEEDDDASTKIASVPQELLAALGEPNKVMDLDLDGLFPPELENSVAADVQSDPPPGRVSDRPSRPASVRPLSVPPEDIDVDVDSLLFDLVTDASDEADAPDEQENEQDELLELQPELESLLSTDAASAADDGIDDFDQVFAPRDSNDDEAHTPSYAPSDVDEAASESIPPVEAEQPSVPVVSYPPLPVPPVARNSAPTKARPIRAVPPVVVQAKEVPSVVAVIPSVSVEGKRTPSSIPEEPARIGGDGEEQLTESNFPDGRSGDVVVDGADVQDSAPVANTQSQRPPTNATDDDHSAASPDAQPAVRQAHGDEDGGAKTAQRTVTRRKPRREDYPLVGHAIGTQRARAKLLRELALRSDDKGKAGLLLAASEMEMQLGEAGEARTLTRAAHEADPLNLLALRSMRRDAFSQGDWGEAEALLQKEIALPLSDIDRGAAAMLLAEVRLAQTHDYPGAAEAASMAYDATKSPTAAILLALARSADGDKEGSAEALGLAGGELEDSDLRSVLRGIAGRSLERRNSPTEAAQLYNGDDIPSLLGRARTAPNAQARRDALVMTSVQAKSPVLRELARRGAALLALAGGDAAWATTGLSDGTRATTHRLRAQAAQAAGSADIREASLEALAACTGGNSRALALVDLAEVLAERGDLEGAEQALRDATLADSKLGTVQVVREVIARKSGDTSRLAQAALVATGGRGAIEAAAMHVRNGDVAEERRSNERAQLQHALEEGVAPLTADTLLLDLCAESGDIESTQQQLRRYADRATGARRVGALLALAERSDDPGAVLAEAREAAPGLAVVTRPLARMLRLSNPERAAAAWLEESEAADRPRAAHAASTAARILLEAGSVEEAHAAARRSFDLTPTPGPASWMLAGDLGSGLEGEELAIFLEEVGDGDTNARRGAVAHATAALRTSSGRGWARALDLFPDDPIAREELLAASDIDARDRAKALSAQLNEGGPVAKRMATLRAGMLHEASGDPAQAAILYRGLDTEGDPLAAHFLDRADLASAGYARVAERRFATVRATAGTPGALAALEALAAIDLFERDDPRSAYLTLQSILDDAPGHLPTLRAIERYFMDQSRDDELAGIQRAFVEHLTNPDDIAASARAASELLLGDTNALGDAADDVLRHAASRILGEVLVGEDRRWIARHLLAGKADFEIRAAAVRCAAHGRPESERGPMLLTELDALLQTSSAAEVAEELVAPEGGGHVILSEVRANLLETAGDPAAAGDAYRRAASLARDSRHELHLHVCAARNLSVAGDTAAAIAALEAAAEIDVTHGEVFDQLRTHYQENNETRKLAALAENRVSAGADDGTLLSLHETQARLKTTLGDRAGAKEALLAALAIDPSHGDALERLAHLCLEDEDWTGAAEALVRFARVRQTRDHLRWVFFELGTIYDRHLPDAKRAEAAYRRVLKLEPDDLEALERLSSFYYKNKMWPQAIDATSELHKREIDPDAKTGHMVRLSRAHEENGELRPAEQTLDQERKLRPNDLEILRALADLYERQNAESALSMHLNRASGDFRRQIEETPSSPGAWTGLAEVLKWRGADDAGRVVASTALASGVSEITLTGRLDANGGVPGGGAAATDLELHELLAPTLLTPATFEVFRQVGPTLDKLLPFDAKAWRTERIDRNDDPVHLEAQRVARWFGHDDVQILISDAAPKVCVPVSSEPLTIVVGREIALHASAEERAFLFARAAKVASVELGVAMRSPPQQLGLYLAALVRLYDPNHQPNDIDEKELEQATKRMSRALPRRVRDDLGPAAVEMGGTRGFDAARIGLAAAQLGDRTGLLATGNVPMAILSLLRLAGISGRGQSADERVDSLRSVPEALDLVRFATSDAHFEARRRIGADRA
jgi:tetratricopeptide (TPR) repeat protein